MRGKSAPRQGRTLSWHDAFSGAVVGAFVGTGVWLLGLPDLVYGGDTLGLGALGGALLGVTRARGLLRAAGGLVLFGLLIVGYTPLVPALVRGEPGADVLRPAPAVVVLSAYVHRDGGLSSQAQDRLLEGYAVLRRGYAARLVLTHATDHYGPQAPAVRRQMRLLGLNYPIDETDPVANTHDEAQAFARLAAARGWRRVILVTHPWHMRRAAAAFRRAGVEVEQDPCGEGEYDVHALGGWGSAPARLTAFRDWLHEAVGYQVYRRRGWV